MTSRIKQIIQDPMKIPRYVFGWMLVVYLRSKSNIDIKGRVTISGRPIIDIARDCKLSIGHNVMLNSRNKGYHLNMFAPVKLFADRAGAEISIGNNTRIHGACLHAYESISVGNNCLIAANSQIFDGNGHDLSFPDVENRIKTTGISKPIVIEDNVWIGTGCLVLPGVRIGHGSVIAANSVVNKDIPPMVLAGGNPAKVIKDYSNSRGGDESGNTEEKKDIK